MKRSLRVDEGCEVEQFYVKQIEFRVRITWKTHTHPHTNTHTHTVTH